MMLKRYILLAVLCLAACDRDPSLPWFSTGLEPEQPAIHIGADTRRMVNIMGAGQSNMAHASPDIVYGLERGLGVRVNFVNCAIGGTYIKEWMPGMAYFEACEQSMPHPDAIIWYQGESDAKPDGDYATWGQKFTVIVAEWRKRHGNIPIVYAQIGVQTLTITEPTIFNFDHWQDVQNQQAMLTLPRAKMITTTDLELIDGIHHTPAAYNILGERYARTLLCLWKT
jgi:hypothetical protein